MCFSQPNPNGRFNECFAFRSLFTHNYTNIYPFYSIFLSLLQSNLTRKIKANILASATNFRISAQRKLGKARAHARAQLTLIVFYKSRRRRHLIGARTQ